MEQILEFDGVKTERIELSSAQIPSTKQIVEEVSFGTPVTSIHTSKKHGILTIAKNYFKRNWMFLAIVFAVWVLFGTGIFPNIPVVSGLIRYFSAAWNGPVADMVDPYTFSVGVIAKATYLLAMTGVVLPFMKGALSGKPNQWAFSNSVQKINQVISEVTQMKATLGLFISSAGLAMIIANFSTRNGKIDKSFVVILLAFICFKSLGSRVNSFLVRLLTKVTELFAMALPGGMKNLSAMQVAFTGLIFGFLAEVILGNFGEKIGYFLGAGFILIGVAFMIFKKEKPNDQKNQR